MGERREQLRTRILKGPDPQQTQPLGSGAPAHGLLGAPHPQAPRRLPGTKWDGIALGLARENLQGCLELSHPWSASDNTGAGSIQKLTNSISKGSLQKAWKLHFFFFFIISFIFLFYFIFSFSPFSSLYFFIFPISLFPFYSIFLLFSLLPVFILLFFFSLPSFIYFLFLLLLSFIILFSFPILLLLLLLLFCFVLFCEPLYSNLHNMAGVEPLIQQA